MNESQTTRVVTHGIDQLWLVTGPPDYEFLVQAPSLKAATTQAKRVIEENDATSPALDIRQIRVLQG